MKYFGSSIEEEIGVKVDPRAQYYPTANPTNYAHSIILDGTGDYVGINDSSRLSLSSMDEEGIIRSSWCMWFKTASTSAAQKISFFSKGDTGGTSGEYRMFLFSGKIHFDTYDSSSSKYRRLRTDVIPAVYDGNWHHICFTIGTGDQQRPNDTGSHEKRIYLDGIEVSYDASGYGNTSFTGPGDDTGKLRIGSMIEDSDYDLDGNIMNIMKWYNYELNPWEVKYICGIHAGHKTYTSPIVDTAIYRGARKLSHWLQCQSVTGFNTTPNSCEWNIDYDVDNGGVCYGNATLDPNDSPTT
tara:strand:+ start:1036 stop:1929 length:894 start_codon:yes stop_codon:yes gene_type:complete